MGDVSQKESTEPQKQTVFKSQDGWVYRIPALFYRRESKTLLAFAEQRGSEDDSTAKNLVMKTGTLKEDSGRKMIEWSEQKQVEKAHLHNHRPMNPCPVYDTTNKKLFLFFTCVENGITEQYQIDNCDNRTRLCYVTTDDLGQSWSDVIDLTDELSEIKKWATFAVGPGHGMQADSGTLIVPTYAYTGLSFPTARVPYALCLYSEGTTWKFGNMLQNESLECEMAQFCNDEGTSLIYCNARTREGGYRHEAVSVNDGKLFDSKTDNPPPNANMLVETDYGCQGSVISFPDQTNKDNTVNKWLLYTHPTDASERINLGVYVNESPQNPHSWSQPWIINSGPSAYSDVVYIDDGWFACLLECGEKKYTEQITSVVFKYDEVKNKCCSYEQVEQRTSNRQRTDSCFPCMIL